MLPGTPRVFTPLGLSDTLDEARGFPGACSVLRNLIFDPSTRGVFQARPAAVRLTQFEGFDTPGFVSALEVVNGVAYGLIATARNAGKDEPFAFVLASGLFRTVSGITAANSPTSPNSTGDWTPPTMALVGTRLVVTHPGFSGAVRFGWFDLSNPLTPAWNGGDTTGTLLPSVPVAVANFMGRAWFAVNPTGVIPATYFTDVGTLNITYGTRQVFTYEDMAPIVRLATFPLANLGEAGVKQALIVFKGSPDGSARMFQVTGDASETFDTTTVIQGVSTTIERSTLQRNQINVPTTTLSPLTTATTPYGLLFLAPDGLRAFTQSMTVEKPIGAVGQGVNVPFLFQDVPTRCVASANAGTYRVTVFNSGTWQEYWLDLTRGAWTGPHTFPASLITTFGTSFIMTPVGIPASLWRSETAHSATTSFTENGTALAWELRTSPMDDHGLMNEFAALEMEVYLQAQGGDAMSIACLDERATTIGLDEYTVEGVSGGVWGRFNWGAAAWSGAAQLYRPRRVDVDRVLVYRKLQVSVSGPSSRALRIGDIRVREEVLDYVQQYP